MSLKTPLEVFEELNHSSNNACACCSKLSFMCYFCVDYGILCILVYFSGFNKIYSYEG